MWGAIFNKSVENGYLQRCPYVSESVKRLLDLFVKYDIHATWAVVGGIGCDTKEEAYSLSSNKIRDPYSPQTLKEYISSIKNEEYFFQPELVKRIADTKNQELASHTFSHFYFFEHTQPEGKLTEEIEICRELFKEKFGVEIKTIILPKNQVNSKLFQLLSENGIDCVRGSQYDNKALKGEKIFRIINYIDAYIPIYSGYCYPIESMDCGCIVNARASRFWRTYNKKLPFLERCKLQKVFAEMNYAAKHHQVYHLWFHPHNLSTNIERNFDYIEKILIHYSELRRKYDFTSLNMGECTTLVRGMKHDKRNQ